MSEAEKAADVEDVLSSIRRLVASGPRSVPKALSPSDILTVSAETEVETETTEPEPYPEPANFVDKINASIAEITQDSETKAPEDTDADTKEPVMADATAKDDAVVQTDASVEPDAAVVEEELLDDAGTRSAHVDAFLANEPVSEADLAAVFADAAEKPGPFVLRADMAADINPVKTTTVDSETPAETEEAALDLNEDENEAQAEYEAAFQDIPEDEVAPADPEDTVIQPADEQFIDEDMLREIVGELVRAELQGDLGDRITRNVRKLVRREIHQALAARDFN